MKNTKEKSEGVSLIWIVFVLILTIAIIVTLVVIMIKQNRQIDFLKNEINSLKNENNNTRIISENIIE